MFFGTMFFGLRLYCSTQSFHQAKRHSRLISFCTLIWFHLSASQWQYKGNIERIKNKRIFTKTWLSVSWFSVYATNEKRAKIRLRQKMRSTSVCWVFFGLIIILDYCLNAGAYTGGGGGGVHRCQWTPLEVSSFVSTCSKSTACALTACEHVFAIDHGPRVAVFHRMRMRRSFNFQGFDCCRARKTM